MDKKSVAAIVTLSIICSAMPLLAAAQGFSFSYGGNYPYHDLNDSPSIVYSTANNSAVPNNPNMPVGFSAAIGTPQGLQTLMTALTSVSYKASWLGNQSITLYNSTIDTPAILADVPSGQGMFSYNFTDIPSGSQQLEVTVVGGGIVWGGNTYYTFYANSSSTLNFTVQPSPAQEPFPTLLAAAIAVVVGVILAISIGLLLYRRHKKASSRLR
jgi:hypothetical protein